MSKFVSRIELADILECDVQTVDNYRKAGLLPKVYHFPTPRNVVWKREDIERFVENAGESD